ncbi:MAG TPA: di-heme oxidoredictase family protein [Candidatus Nitrosotalea sp.]|nr:di-heme oxidoredictase family protein [Candidatus Nitrosotalea sp.]
MTKTRMVLAVLAVLLGVLMGVVSAPYAQLHLRARDPGPRGGPDAAGGPLPGLTAAQLAVFEAGQQEFNDEEGVGDGLGPRFNMNSCGGCHAQGGVGGTSPAVNPQVAIATASGARNSVPFFVKPDGPVREARFKYKPDGTRDGGVHALFVISGRLDDSGNAGRCGIRQEDFAAQARAGNLIFRIPTPVFGAGLIEQIADGAIVANQAANSGRKGSLGIRGRPHRVPLNGTTNVNGNDGTIARFGWKAQNKSLLLFSGEAYNVEMGISNELFQTERDETANCQFAPTPNDITKADAVNPVEGLSAIEKFAHFMRFLAPPTPSPSKPGGATSIANGRALFQTVGCALCHTPTLTTGNAAVAALRNQPVNLYSDLLLHNMGSGLADDILQVQAGPDEFRTAPLWGLGQRLFFLHDGRTNDLPEAIQAHAGGPSGKYVASEANGVIAAYNRLTEQQKQDVLNFLRSL